MPFIESATSYTWDESILAGCSGIRVPRHVDIDATKVTADSLGNKSFSAGHFVTTTGRIYPAAYVVDNSGAATSIQVSNAQVFVVGDTIVRLSDSAAIGDVTAIDTDTNTLTVTANALAPIAADTGIGVDGLTLAGLLLTGVDLNRSSEQYGLATSASVITARLPYWDSAIDTAFPEITSGGAA